MTITNGGPGSSTKMYYFQAEIVNFRDGIRTLKADQRGVYLSVLLEIYDAMGPVKSDAKRLSMATGLDARLIARVIPELAAMGKLYVADGWVHNSRAEKEIADYLSNHKRLSKVAVDREAVKRETRTNDAVQIDDLKQQLTVALRELNQTSPLALPDVSLSSALALGDVSTPLGEGSKKSNEINGKEPVVCQRSTTTRAREELRTKNLEEESLLSEIGSDLGLKAVKPKAKPTYPEAFEVFWRQYPDTRNNSKSKAQTEWAKLTPGDKLGAAAALPAFARYCLDNKDYRCVHAERFIRDRRFEGYAPQSTAPGGTASSTVWWKDPAKVAAITESQWRNSIVKYANGVWPPDKLGPSPGGPKCVVPKHLIDELRLTERYDQHGISRGKH